MKNASKDINIQYYKTKIGELILGSFEGKLCMCDWRYRKARKAVDSRLQKGLDACFVDQDDGILQEVRKQLDEYLEGERKGFDIPILTVGTNFQKSVWRALEQVKYGQTSSYLEIAKKANNPKAIRAAATAVGANAISFIIPCHRIIQTNGSLGSYAGGLSTKKELLEMEGRIVNKMV